MKEKIKLQKKYQFSCQVKHLTTQRAGFRCLSGVTPNSSGASHP